MQKLVNILLKIAYVHTSVFNCLTEVFCGLEFCGLCSKNALFCIAAISRKKLYYA